MISDGLELVPLAPWFGHGMDISVGTHSYLASVPAQFGLILFPLFCLPFVYIIMVSRKLGRHGRSEQVRSLATGIFIAGLVAVPEALYSITLSGSGYMQVFWLLMAYLHISNRELAKSTPHEVKTLNKSFAYTKAMESLNASR